MFFGDIMRNFMNEREYEQIEGFELEIRESTLLSDAINDYRRSVSKQLLPTDYELEQARAWSVLANCFVGSEF